MSTVTDWHRLPGSSARCIRRWLFVGFAVALLLAEVDATASESVSVGEWVDARGEVVPETWVLDRLRQADVALLGEVHDGKAIHRKQRELLRRIDRPVVLAMEQLDRASAGSRLVLNEQAGSLSARERARKWGFDFDGWGWDQYGELFELATARGWPLWPMNLSRERAFAVARAGDSDWRQQLSAADAAEIKRLSPELSLPEERQKQLLADLQDAHCGRMPPAHLGGMARAQVARDVLMASALVDARGEYPGHLVVAVMGNQHARKDRGAGYWLTRAAGNKPARLVSVGMLPIDSFDDLSAAVGPFDFVWISEPIERESPCERD